MKTGLIFEEGELRYYRNGELFHAGAIEVDGDIYYIDTNGRAVKGQHVVHGSMANNLLKRGTYTFGDDYKLVKDSYIAPRRKENHRSKKKASKSAVAGLVVMAAALLVGIIVLNVDKSPSVNTPEQTGIILPEFDEEVLLCAPAAKQEYDGELALETAVQSGNPYRSFQFNYELESGTATLWLSENEAITDAKEYTLDAESEYITIDNLKTGTDYYYKVVMDTQVYLGSFRTASAPRFVSIPGVANTRDIGGYKTLDGKTVKQGLLIRGVELDGLVNPDYFLPEDQVDAVLDTFGFVYDMDLRQPSVSTGEFQSRLGTSVCHKFYSAPAYDEIFNEERYASLQAIFADLADPDNYPMYLHCTWGADRTGTIVFLLQGILNVSEEDMMREYMLTSYRISQMLDSERIDAVVSQLDACDGDTLQERIVTYLTEEVGVTEAQLRSIREIFLG